MATRSPTDFHAYWGAYANVAALPLGDPRLQAGDTAYAIAETSVFVYDGTAWIPLGEDRPTVVFSALTTRTISDADNNTIELCTANTTVERTIPTGLLVGTTVEFVQAGNGQVRLVPGAGMSFVYPGGFISYAVGLGSPIVATIVAPNIALLRGDLQTWSPAALTNIRGWYRADSGVSLVGADVDAWADQSSAAQNLTAAVAGVRPVFVASDASFNNQPSVRFQIAASEWLRNTAFNWGVAAPLNNPGSAIFYVLKRATTGAGGVAITYDNLAGYNITGAASGQLQVQVISATHTPAVDFNAQARQAFTVYNGANFETFVGGVSVGGPTAQTGGGTNSLIFALGGNTTGGSNLDVDIAEVAVMRAVPTLAERSAWNNYTATRYAL